MASYAQVLKKDLVLPVPILTDEDVYELDRDWEYERALASRKAKALVLAMAKRFKMRQRVTVSGDYYLDRYRSVVSREYFESLAKAMRSRVRSSKYPVLDDAEWSRCYIFSENSKEDALVVEEVIPRLESNSYNYKKKKVYISINNRVPQNCFISCPWEVVSRRYYKRNRLDLISILLKSHSEVSHQLAIQLMLRKFSKDKLQELEAFAEAQMVEDKIEPQGLASFMKKSLGMDTITSVAVNLEDNIENITKNFESMTKKIEKVCDSVSQVSDKVNNIMPEAKETKDPSLLSKLATGASKYLSHILYAVMSPTPGVIALAIINIIGNLLHVNIDKLYKLMDKIKEMWQNCEKKRTQPTHADAQMDDGLISSTACVLFTTIASVCKIVVKPPTSWAGIGDGLFTVSEAAKRGSMVGNFLKDNIILFKRVINYFIGLFSSNAEIFESLSGVEDDRLKKWYLESISILHPSVRDRIFLEQDWSMKVFELATLSRAYVFYVSKREIVVPQILSNAVIEIHKQLLSLEKELINRHAFNPVRYEPLVIWTYGQAGTGKSRFSEDIAATLARMNSQNPIYYPITSGQKYWDGYKNNDVVFIDDYLSLAPSIDPESYTQFLQMKSCCLFNPPFAQAHEKDRYVNFKNLVITANKDYFNEDPAIHDIDAYNRRRDILLRFECRDIKFKDKLRELFTNDQLHKLEHANVYIYPESRIPSQAVLIERVPGEVYRDTVWKRLEPLCKAYHDREMTTYLEASVKLREALSKINVTESLTTYLNMIETEFNCFIKNRSKEDKEFSLFKVWKEKSVAAAQMDAEPALTEQKTFIDKKSNIAMEQLAEDVARTLPAPLSSYRMAVAQESQDYSTLHERWLRLATFRWSTSDVQGVNIPLVVQAGQVEVKHLDLPNDALSSHKDSPNLQMFFVHAYCKMDVEVMVQLNCDKYKFGSLQVSGLYLPVDTAYLADLGYDSLVSASQRTCCYVNAGTSNDARMVMKYKFPSSLMPTNSCRMFRLVVRVLNPLLANSSTTSSCSGTVFVRFLNAKFFGMRSRQAQMDTIADLCNTGSNVLRSVASMVPRDNPPYPLQPVSLVPTAVPSFCYMAHIPEPVAVLRTDPRGQTPSFNRANETDLKLSLQRESLHMSYLFDSSALTTGKKILDFPLAPLRSNDKYMIGQDVSATAEKFPTSCYPAISVLSSMFGFWSGDIIYTFRFVASMFHTVRLVACVIPGYQEGVTLTLDQALRSPSHTFDLQDSSEFEFRAAYFNHTPWSRTYDNTIDDFPCRIAVYCLNPLITISNVVNKIYCNVFIRGADNFEVAVPRLPVLSPSWTTDVHPPSGEVLVRYNTESSFYVSYSTKNPTKEGKYCNTMYLQNVTNGWMGFKEAEVGVVYELQGVTTNHTLFQCCFDSAKTIPIVYGVFDPDLVTVNAQGLMVYPATEKAKAYSMAKAFKEVEAGKRSEARDQYGSIYSKDGPYSQWRKSSLDSWENANNNPQKEGYPVWRFASAQGPVILEKPSETTNLGEKYFGEKIENLVDICKRWAHYLSIKAKTCKSDFPRDCVYLARFPIRVIRPLNVTTSGCFDNRARYGAIGLIASAYLGFRGGMRFRFIAIGDVPEDAIMYVQHRFDMRLSDLDYGKKVHSVADMMSTQYATAAQVLKVNPILTIEVPYYQMYDFLVNYPTPGDPRESNGSMYVWVHTAKEVDVRIEVYYSFADDAYFTGWQGFPDMVDLTTIKPEKSVSSWEIVDADAQMNPKPEDSEPKISAEWEVPMKTYPNHKDVSSKYAPFEELKKFKGAVEFVTRDCPRLSRSVCVHYDMDLDYLSYDPKLGFISTRFDYEHSNKVLSCPAFPCNIMVEDKLVVNPGCCLLATEEVIWANLAAGLCKNDLTLSDQIYSEIPASDLELRCPVRMVECLRQAKKKAAQRSHIDVNAIIEIPAVKQKKEIFRKIQKDLEDSHEKIGVNYVPKKRSKFTCFTDFVWKLFLKFMRGLWYVVCKFLDLLLNLVLFYGLIYGAGATFRYFNGPSVIQNQMGYSNVLSEGQLHPSGDYKTIKASRNIRHRALNLLGGQGPEDPIYEQIARELKTPNDSYNNIVRKIEENVINLVGITETGERYKVRCLGLYEKTVLILKHYVEHWQSKNITRIVGITAKASSYIEMNINNMEFKWTEAGYGTVVLPNHFPVMFSNITKYMPSESANLVFPSKMNMLETFTDRTNVYELQVKELRTSIRVGSSVTYKGWEISQGFEYNWGAPGRCGSVLLCPNLSTPLVGLHSAGIGTGIGYSEMLLRETFVQKENTLSFVKPQMDIKEHTYCLDGEYVIEGTLSSDMMLHSNNETRIIPSEISGVFPIKTEPAPLVRTDERLERPEDPLQLGVSKRTQPVKDFDTVVLDNAAKDLARKLFVSVKPLRHPSVLTKIQAIEGLPIPGYQSVDMSTSEGFPWVKLRPSGYSSKRWMFDISSYPDGRLKVEGIVEELEDVLNLKLEQRKQGLIPMTYFSACLKDARIKKEKVSIPGKTRVFEISPIDLTIVQRQYFMDFDVAYQTARLDAENTIGINPDGEEWADFANRLLSFSSHILTADYSGYGPRLNHSVLLKTFDITIAWYDYVDPDNENANEDELVREVLKYEVSQGLHVVKNLVFRPTSGLPSGNPETVQRNSLSNSLYIRCIYIDLARKHAPQYADFYWFNQFVLMFHNGDDLIIAVKEQIIDWFNNQTLIDAFAKYDIKMTDALKTSGVIQPYCSLEEATYLKRGFKKHPTRKNKWLAPLELDSITDTANWIWKSTNSREASLVNSEQCCRLAYSHGPEVYNEIVNKVSDAWLALGVNFRAPSWESLDCMVWENCDGPKFSF